ncbi:hypothetical protein MFLAVUS_005384 [Mucor flavus]|uniref:Dienelactone hydrolase domain-containing protein n=1 Tax=Mucor flavus TaxID=439312 RepID=A0ABP9YYM7_9FUNG
MSFTKACCSLPPVQSDYTPQGEIINLGDLPVYVVGPKDATKAIFVFYDIYGFHVNTKQFCDILAKNCGWRVVLPDFFRGDYYPPSELGDKERLMKWWATTASTEIITPDVLLVEKYLKDSGVKKAGFAGFCWGAKIAVQLTASLPFFLGAALIHASVVEIADAENAGAPILNLPSKDEPDMTEYMAVLAKKPFGDKCKMVVFDDMHHGFCGARGDYTNELNAKRATEAIQLTVNFFSDLFSDSA